MPRWRLRVFEQLRLESDDLEIQSFGTVRAAKLFVILALSRTGRLTRDRLADLLWPDDFYDATRLRLRQEIFRLKKALECEPLMIGSSSTEVWIDKSLIRTDLDVLREGAKNLDEVNDDQLLTGGFLSDWTEPWAVAERNVAEQLQIQSALSVAALRMERGDSESGVSLLQRLAVSHPEHDDVRQALAAAISDVGSISTIVAEYQKQRRKSESSAKERKQNALQTADWDGTIPVPLEPMFGRDELLLKAVGMLQKKGGPRIVSLVGPGGIGKTRVATEIAHILTSDGCRVAFVSLADVEDPSFWAREVLSKLGVELPPDADEINYLSSVLSGEDTVVVLDNLETVLPFAAIGIRRLASLTTSVRFLVTSIITPRINGEVLLTVSALEPEGPGKEILVTALQTHRPGFEPSQADHDALLSLSRRLDGYPLALRLMAARLRLISPQELEKQFDMVAAATRSAELPERHRSLDNALASSMSNLTGTLRELLDRIAAYPAGLGTELAVSDWGSAEILDSIEELLDHSLLTVEDQEGIVRVRVLTPVRTYLLREMDEGYRESLERRFVKSTCEYLLKAEIEPWRPVRTATLTKLRAEADNIQFAWRWACQNDPALAARFAVAFARFESLRGRSNLSLDSLIEQQSKWESLPIEQKVQWNIALVHIALTSFIEHLAIGPLEIIRKEVEDQEILAWANLCEALIVWRTDFRESITHGLNAIEFAEKHGFRFILGRAHFFVGKYFVFVHEVTEGTKHLKKAYDLLDAENAETEMVALANIYGTQLWFLGEDAESERVFRRAECLISQGRDPASQAHFYEVQGRILIEQHKPQLAEAKFRESLAIWESIGSDFQQADQYNSITRALVDQDRWKDARKSAVLAADFWMKDNNKGGMCSTLVHLANILISDGDREKGIEILTFARLFEKTENLVLVKGELDYRERVQAKLDRLGTTSLPIDFETAYSLFDVIR